MLRVRTTLTRSAIHGLGLFSAQPIPRGTVVWEFDQGLDVSVTETWLLSAHTVVKEWFHRVGWRHGVVWYAAADYAGFINHDANPNLITGPGTDPLVAARNISPGEELTEDYASYDDVNPRDLIGSSRSKR